jgi:hypothetical protein
MNVLLHNLQENGRPPLCNLIWVLRLERWVNFFSHIMQEYGCSPVCVLRCMFRLERWVNCFLHTSHEKGLSPVCTLVCLCSSLRKAKLLLHTSHEKRRSVPLNPVTELRLWLTDVTHVSQRDNISLLLALSWPGVFLLRENAFLYVSQESKLSSLCNSDNSALSSPRISSTLISFMKCAASIRVAFNLTLWKEKEIYLDLSSWHNTKLQKS